MELCKGMYVRTKKRTLQPPQIARIRNMSKDSGYKNQYYIELDKNLIPSYEYHIYEEDILKASYNLIDLIEVGDYVNGYYVEDIGKTFVNVATGSNYFQNPTIYEDDIKSIVTKEAFSSVEYRVENN